MNFGLLDREVKLKSIFGFQDYDVYKTSEPVPAKAVEEVQEPVEIISPVTHMEAQPTIINIKDIRPNKDQDTIRQLEMKCERLKEEIRLLREENYRLEAGNILKTNASGKTYIPSVDDKKLTSNPWPTEFNLEPKPKSSRKTETVKKNTRPKKTPDSDIIIVDEPIYDDKYRKVVMLEPQYGNSNISLSKTEKWMTEDGEYILYSDQNTEKYLYVKLKKYNGSMNVLHNSGKPLTAQMCYRSLGCDAEALLYIERIN